MKKINNALINIQNELKAPKGQRNTFGKYNFRSAEDIEEAVKPLNLKYQTVLTLSDDVVLIGERYYVKATALLVSIEDESEKSVTAFARESEIQKGMNSAQITGSASSYARKYSLNGLYNIDDTKDANFENTTKEYSTPKAPTYQKPKQTDEELQMQQLTTQAKLDKKKFLDESLLECGSDKTLWTKLMKQTVLALGAKEYKDLDFMQTSKFVVKGKFLELLEQHNKLKESGV